MEIHPNDASGDVVCITMNPDADEKPITLSGHIDTVHAVGSFGSPAVKTDDKNIYGPGVMDCKGGVVAAFYAMDALARCEFRNRPVQLLLQTDEEGTNDKDTVKLMTIHSSKGLEWDTTFLIGLELNKFPNYKSDILAEARLMYVGITRAKKDLYVSCIDYSDFYKEYTSYFGGTND